MTTRQFRETSALRIFLSYFRPHRRLFILDMCCALLIALIDLAFPYVSRWCMYQDRKERRVGKECRSRWSPYH